MKRKSGSREEKEKIQSKLRKYDTEIRVTGMRSRIPGMNRKNVLVLNCTSKSKEPKWRQLSPFNLGPVEIPSPSCVSENHENAWQFSKVYAIYTDEKNEPTKEHWKWAAKGWSNPKAVRFPMGKGKKPKYSLWDGKKLGYIEARKKIYAPTYAKLVMKTEAFNDLKDIMESGRYKIIWLRDFDGYCNTSLYMTLKDVVDEPKRKMGHAFVLAGCLTGNMFWE